MQDEAKEERNKLENKKDKKDRKKKQKDKRTDGGSSDKVEQGFDDCDVSAALEEAKVASKKHKKKKSKDLDKNQKIPDDKVQEHERVEVELELDSKEDGSKKKKKNKRKKNGNGDEECDKRVNHVQQDEAQKGEESRKRKRNQGDDVGARLSVHAEVKVRKKDRMSTASALGTDENKTAGNAADASLENNLGFGRCKVGSGDEMEERRKDREEVQTSGYKKRTKREKAFDNPEFENGSYETGKEVKQPLSIGDNKAAEEDISEMASHATEIGKKRKKSKEKKDKKGDNQTAKGPSKNEVNLVDKKTEKKSPAAKPEGNGEISSTKKKKKGSDDFEASDTKNKGRSTKDGSDTSALKKNKKKVSFSSEVEVFPAGNENLNNENTEKPLIQGKRFTPEEDEKIKEAIDEYVQAHQLGEEGKSVHTGRYWCIDAWYPITYRRLKEEEKQGEEEGIDSHGGREGRRKSRQWRKWWRKRRKHTRNRWWEEGSRMGALDMFHAKHGADWKTLAAQIGKHRIHLKDCWRRIKSPNFRRGTWSQDEYQTLFDLVNLDLRMKAFEEKKTKHGMVSTTNITFGQSRLLKVDACCLEDVDWDNLLQHRSGEICRKRWGQMTRHIGGFKEKPFIEQVEVLSKRYCPEMIEYRK
ncbi:SANT [Musa troglodytarum]|uniref:SANT n=1 Tax=Musa troglodytarum TaxID=320322 RepID=A0A9E7H283_9LILI|nr:SANT [Musa troglodytarum]